MTNENKHKNGKRGNEKERERERERVGRKEEINEERRRDEGNT